MDQQEQNEMVVVINAVPGSITENFKALKAQLDTEMEKYQGATVSKDTYRDAYKSRADLKKMIDALETKRKSVKRDYLIPYEVFESEYKVMLTSLNNTWANLDKQIKDIDQELVEEKKTSILEMINERLAKEPEHIERFVRSNDWAMWNKKWENKGTKFDDVVFEFETNVKGIKDDFELLSAHGIYSPQMLERYKQDGDLSACLKLERKLISEAEAFQVQQERINAATTATSQAPAKAPATAPEEALVIHTPWPAPIETHDFVYPYPSPASDKEKTQVKVAMTLEGPAYAIKWLLDVADIVNVSHERFNPNK
jgi:hypothetical protein